MAPGIDPLVRQPGLLRGMWRAALIGAAEGVGLYRTELPFMNSATAFPARKSSKQLTVRQLEAFHLCR